MTFTEEDRAAVEAAVREAEAGTSAEIVVMLVRRAIDTRAAEIMAAAIAALGLPTALLPFEEVSALLIWVAQLAVFVALATLLPLLGLGTRLVGKEARGKAVRAAAEAQFYAHGLRNTDERAAVLIYVALAERAVEVVTDDAAGAVGPAQWRGLAGDLARRLKAGQARDGLCEAARRAGDLLSGRFPPRAGDRNELPDVIVRD